MAKRWTLLATLVGVGLAGGYYTLTYTLSLHPHYRPQRQPGNNRETGGRGWSNHAFTFGGN